MAVEQREIEASTPTRIELSPPVYYDDWERSREPLPGPRKRRGWKRPTGTAESSLLAQLEVHGARREHLDREARALALELGPLATKLHDEHGIQEGEIARMANVRRATVHDAITAHRNATK